MIRNLFIWLIICYANTSCVKKVTKMWFVSKKEKFKKNHTMTADDMELKRLEPKPKSKIHNSKVKSEMRQFSNLKWVILKRSKNFSLSAVRRPPSAIALRRPPSALRPILLLTLPLSALCPKRVLLKRSYFGRTSENFSWPVRPKIVCLTLKKWWADGGWRTKRDVKTSF